jgi:hypothetical protein
MTTTVYALLQRSASRTFCPGGNNGTAASWVAQLEAPWPLAAKAPEIQALASLQSVLGVNISLAKEELTGTRFQDSGRVLRVSFDDEAKAETVMRRILALHGVQAVAHGTPTFDL